MQSRQHSKTVSVLLWGMLAVACAGPLIAAAFSPQLAWREPIYILAGFAGILGLALMLVQPLLAAGLLPGVSVSTARRLHTMTGVLLVSAVVTHVVALWITSPPDVVDALLFSSPTPFSIWGVLAMWAVFAAALLVVLRRKLRLSWTVWRTGHVSLVAVAVAGTVAHALLIEGTMETYTKIALCIVVPLVLLRAVMVLRARRVGAHRRA